MVGSVKLVSLPFCRPKNPSAAHGKLLIVLLYHPHNFKLFHVTSFFFFNLSLAVMDI